MQNANKDIDQFYADEPPGMKTDAIRWFQRQVMRQSRALPREFTTVQAWESFRKTVRSRLPAAIGLPQFPSLRESFVRSRIRVGERTVCERVDVYVDDEYAVPALVFTPADPPREPMPGLVWSPGWPETKWKPSYQQFAERMTQHGYVMLIMDHAPFGETGFPGEAAASMTLVMGMGNVLGLSQLGMRAAETMRCGEYLRARDDVDAARVAVAGLCQGGMDSWLAGALDEGFCAVAPICAASTFGALFAEMASYTANADVSPFPFGILKVCDVDHLHAAIAPRPLLVRANLPDNWWPVSGYDEIESLTRRIYRLYRAEDKVDFRSEVHEHDLTGPFAHALEAYLLAHV